ncbi:MLX-interacting protein-like [Ambystoma mexicanum]|uniref:MLX-interacting protein-like n=1 Tax=Ambystoma mexicanum TaxID=8296 RepID=UPI0037E845FD
MMSRPQIIHSGHFMVSEPHADRALAAGGTEEDDDEDDDDVPAESVVMDLSERVLVELGPEPTWRGKKGAWEYDFDTVNERTCQTYRYGPGNRGGYLSIDASLTKLFECMTLAYSGKIVSPKWKTFKGLKLLQRDKIRLNNAIWRAWYLQYVEKQKNPICNFVTPLEGNDVDYQRNPEAVLMEGKYRKRHSEIVIREYHKWRLYVRSKLRQKKGSLVSSAAQNKRDDMSWRDLEDSTNADSPMDLDPLHDFNALIAELTDTLFSTRNPYSGPNPRAYASLGNADMIQPSLSQLHPNLGEDFMDTIEPLHDFFTASAWSLPVTSSTVTQSSILPESPVIGSDFRSLELGPLDVQNKGDCTSDPIPCSLPPQDFSQKLELPVPLNGHQTLLPYFTNSQVPASPPAPLPAAEPSTPVFHLQPCVLYQRAPFFSIVTPSPVQGPELCQDPIAVQDEGQHTEGTFVVPMSGPILGGSSRRRHLQKIAPRGTVTTTGRQIVPASPFMAQLVIAGSSGQPTRNQTQPCGATDLPSTVLINPTQNVENTSLPLSTQLHFTDEEETSSGDRNTLSAKGSRRAGPPSLDRARRMHITYGLEALANLVHPENSHPGVKMSKAVLLQKSVTFITRLQQERRRMQEDAQRLRDEIEELNAAISEYQQQLPASGAPAIVNHTDQMNQLYENYVQRRTLENWKFWLFSIIFKPLFKTYQEAVSTKSHEEFNRSILTWLKQHCALPVLRPAISSSLLQIIKVTSILTNPGRLPEQARQAVTKNSQEKGSS